MSLSITERSEGQDPVAETEVESMQEIFLLTFSHGLLTRHCIMTQCGDGTIQGGLGSPTSTINKENGPQGMSTVQSGGNIFSINIPFFPLTLSFVKLSRL